MPDTNVLTTCWLAPDGSAEVTDLMPHPDVYGAVHTSLIRRVRATRGTVQFRLRCRPRFDYARILPSVQAADDGVIFKNGDAAMVRLAGSVALIAGDHEVTATFTLAAGEEASFVLASTEIVPLDAAAVARTIAQTVAAWQRWSTRSTYRGRWREEVMRSALALKLLTSCKQGSIAAAATFGLPEATGAGRNWDYRASWISRCVFHRLCLHAARLPRRGRAVSGVEGRPACCRWAWPSPPAPCCSSSATKSFPNLTAKAMRHLPPAD